MEIALRRAGDTLAAVENSTRQANADPGRQTGPDSPSAGTEAAPVPTERAFAASREILEPATGHTDDQEAPGPDDSAERDALVTAALAAIRAPGSKAVIDAIRTITSDPATPDTFHRIADNPGLSPETIRNVTLAGPAIQIILTNEIAIAALRKS